MSYLYPDEHQVILFLFNWATNHAPQTAMEQGFCNSKFKTQN